VATEVFTDKVVDGLHKRLAGVRTKLQERYKKTKPFRMEEVSDDEMLNYYEQMTPQGMANLIKQEGRETINSWIMEMEQMKSRRER